MKWNDPKAQERFYSIGESLGASRGDGLELLWTSRPTEMDDQEFDEQTAEEIIQEMLPIINLLS